MPYDVTMPQWVKYNGDHMVPVDLSGSNEYMKTATFNPAYNSHQAQGDEMKWWNEMMKWRVYTV